MNGRRILVIAATAICWMTAPDRGSASADNASPGFDSGSSFDRPGTAMPTGISLGLPAPVEAASADPSLGSNPLWGVPLSALYATRDRPLFSPSRRPTTAAVIRPPARTVKTASPPATPKPTLDLVGTVEGNSEGYAVFIDTTTHAIVRLKTGEGQDGWVLRSVSEREAVLSNDNRTEVFELPSTNGLSNK